jgi:hypothetical protein
MTGQGASTGILFRDCVIALFIGGIAPFIAGFFFTVPPGSVLALMSATLILEYGAVFVGTALGMDGAITFIVISLVATGMIFLQFSLFDHAGKSSPRVARFLERVRGKYGTSTVIKKYGVFALVPGMLAVGFYGCPAVTWLLGWDRRIALILMMGTFCCASVFLLPVSEGFIHWIAGLAG